MHNQEIFPMGLLITVFAEVGRGSETYFGKGNGRLRCRFDRNLGAQEGLKFHR